jgi:hypothetical protein
LIKQRSTKETQRFFFIAAGFGIALLAASGQISAQDIVEEQAAPVQSEKDYSFAEVVTESVTGDVYSDEAAANWQDLSYSNLFSKGWDKPWSSPPNGGGGAPRQGWLNAYDGVFYRLSIATFGWQHGINGGDGYNNNLISYTPLNQRMEIQTDIPIMTSTPGASGNGSETNFGDFTISPRIILSESKNVTQLFSLAFRTPTGDVFNGNHVASIGPKYQFWANSWKGLVVRGGAGFEIPYSGDITRSGARSFFEANLAVGYYFTPHDFTPVGDMVWYVSTTVRQPIDNRGTSNNTFLTLTPGFRTHVGDNWFLLGAVEVPVTSPTPYDYQVQAGIMKVY